MGYAEPMRTALVCTLLTLALPGAALAQTGACCTDFSCDITTQAVCTGPWFEGTACSPDPCPQMTAACCRGGECSIAVSFECVTLGGFPAGPTCLPHICEFVACCEPSGECVVLSLAFCVRPRVLASGVCGPGACPIGACCGGDNSCEITLSDNCNPAWFPGETCSQATCLNGACCDGSRCNVRFEGTCRGAGRHYAGVGTTCLMADGAQTCCRADFNQNGELSVQDIFEFLAAYFSNRSEADINGSFTNTVQDIFDFLAAYFAGCT